VSGSNKHFVPESALEEINDEVSQMSMTKKELSGLLDAAQISYRIALCPDSALYEEVIIAGCDFERAIPILEKAGYSNTALPLTEYRVEVPKGKVHHRMTRREYDALPLPTQNKIRAAFGRTPIVVQEYLDDPRLVEELKADGDQAIREAMGE
jgi:hypothetical protein